MFIQVFEQHTELDSPTAVNHWLLSSVILSQQYAYVLWPTQSQQYAYLWSVAAISTFSSFIDAVGSKHSSTILSRIMTAMSYFRRRLSTELNLSKLCELHRIRNSTVS